MRGQTYQRKISVNRMRVRKMRQRDNILIPLVNDTYQHCWGSKHVWERVMKKVEKRGGIQVCVPHHLRGKKCLPRTWKNIHNVSILDGLKLSFSLVFVTDNCSPWMDSWKQVIFSKNTVLTTRAPSSGCNAPLFTLKYWRF